MSSGFPPADPQPRTDLGWLRHRSRRNGHDGAQAASSAVADFIAGRAVRPGRVTPGTPPEPVRPRPEPARPQPQPQPIRPQEPAAPSAGTSLDLSGPAAPPPPPAPAPSPPPSGDTSLDLSTPAAPTPTAEPFTLGAPVPEPRRPERPVPRVTAGARTILTGRAPTVTLSRVQSGIGTLVIEAVCSPAVGDLRLGALYELADGDSSLVQRTIGLTTAPPRSRRPVILGAAGRYEHLTVDLRQARALRRLLVYAFSESGRPLAWGGTLITTTFGQARVELPLDEFAGHDGQVALLSLYVVDGEFVLRAERERVTGEVREVARRYGYDRIAWADDRTPAP